MSTERRRYFRIEDHILLSYRVMHAAACERPHLRPRADEVGPAGLHAALQPLETRLQDLLPLLRSENRTLVEAIDLLNRKLTLIAQAVSLAGPHAGHAAAEEREPIRVSISGGGIGLPAPDALPPGTRLALELVLLPGHHLMRMTGRVVDCREAGRDDCLIAIEFGDVREEDREILVQHIARRQLASLRQERRGRDGA